MRFHGPTGISSKRISGLHGGTSKAVTQSNYLSSGGHTLDAIDEFGLRSKFSHLRWAEVRALPSLWRALAWNHSSKKLCVQGL